MRRPRHTVLYTHGGGRLGNQLLRFVHWMAWAREHEGEVEVIDMAFWPYARFFQQWQSHPACVYPVRPHRLDAAARQFRRLPVWLGRRAEWRLQRAVHAIGRCWPGWQAMALDDPAGENIDLESPDFFSSVTQHRVTTCAGWKISGWNFLAKHQVMLRECFRPEPAFLHRAEKFIAPLRGKYDVLAGLLIRQSDYRTWHDGRFCFSAGTYAGWIRQLLDLHPGRRVAVVMACDEPQDPSDFAGLPCYFASGSVNAVGHWFESFVELSLCDFVLSPPSTFSATGAFIGAIPLWPLLATGQALAFDQIITDALPSAAVHPVFGLSVK
jgi:hypothetical protein